MPNSPHLVLKDLVDRRVCTVPELAEAMGRISAQTVYGYLEDDGRPIPVERLLLVSYYVERTYGLTDVADCFHTPEFMSVRRDGSTTDGRIEDEIADMSEVLADWRRSHRAGDPDAFARALQRGAEVMQNASAEGRLLRGG